MTRFSFTAWLVFLVLMGGVYAATPAAAQLATTNNQVRSTTQSGVSGSAPAPTTGVFCIEEMTANFCNVVTRPNTGGYGARNGSSNGPGGGTASIPPCPAEPPFNELCN
ncbi:MAG: hypothetical protein ACTHJS_18725 [Xanthobacteraceae bacterium]|jgi:hypothetical protein